MSQHHLMLIPVWSDILSQHHLMLIPVWSDILCHSTIWCWYPSDETFYVTAPSDADTRLIRLLRHSTIWCWYPSDQTQKSTIAPLHFSNFSILCQFLILSELPRFSHLSPLVSVVLSVCLSVSVRLGIFQDSWEQSPGIYSVPWRLSGILNKHPAATKVLCGEQSRSHWFKSTDRFEIWNTPALDHHLQARAAGRFCNKTKNVHASMPL
jgi:hypothetical protein